MDNWEWLKICREANYIPEEFWQEDEPPDSITVEDVILDLEDLSEWLLANYEPTGPLNYLNFLLSFLFFRLTIKSLRIAARADTNAE